MQPHARSSVPRAVSLATTSALALVMLSGRASASLPVAPGSATNAIDAAARRDILREIALAQALPRGLRRQRLLALAGAVADPHGIRAAALITAFDRDSDPSAAALAATRARMAPNAVIAVASPPPDPESPPPALAIARAVPILPEPPPFADPAATLAFSRAVLARNPDDANARDDAARAALQLNDAGLARQLASDALEADPNDPAAWVLAARVARHDRDARLAMLDLQRARDLRQQQIGSDTGAGMASDASNPDGTTALPPSSPVAATDLAGLPDTTPNTSSGTRTAQTIYTNPFRDQQQQVGAGETATPAVSSDPMTQQIDSTLATLQAEVAPQVAAELDITGRSGQQGLSNLGAVGIPIEATFSPNGYGKLRLLARPTYLFAGTNGATPLKQAQFGTLAFGVNGKTQETLAFSGPGIDYQDGKGVELNVDYAYSWLEADVGSTPLGFPLENVVGGLTLTPRLTDDLGLRLIAERRAVTDSLLSYAGATDPRTGNKMGGVTKDRFYAQVELNEGNGFWYAGAGGSRLTGENVERNTQVEAGAGVNYPVWSTRTDTIRVGLNLVYFGFDKNLEYFTLGQGGYFSPQTYFAALVPVSYSEKLGRLSYLLSGSVGLQTYHQDGTPFYPTNAALQAALVAKAATTPGLQTSYAGQSATGPSGSIHGEVQYEITPDFDVGGAATFQRAGDFDQGEGLVYARYIFDGVR